MNCPNCGALIPDGSGFCGACGANLAQPQNMQGGFQQPQNIQGGFQPQQNMQGGFQPQQNMQGGFQPQQNMQGGFQPQQNMQGGYQQQNMQGGFQPQQNMQGGYQQMNVAPKPKMIHVPKYVKPSVCRIVGAVLILVFSFVPVWFGMGAYGMYQGVGFFATGGGILALWGVLFILAGLALLFLEVDLPALRNLQSRLNGIPYFRFFIPGFCVLNFILGTFAHSGGGSSVGWGWWMIMLGILLTFVAPVADIINEKKQ